MNGNAWPMSLRLDRSLRIDVTRISTSYHVNSSHGWVDRAAGIAWFIAYFAKTLQEW